MRNLVLLLAAIISMSPFYSHAEQSETMEAYTCEQCSHATEFSARRKVGRIPVIPRNCPELKNQEGISSVYGNGDGFAGKKTASGVPFNINATTAAHICIPLGSKVKITAGKKSVVATINDRGPYIQGRILDLSPAVHRRLFGKAYPGLRKIKIEVIGKGIKDL